MDWKNNMVKKFFRFTIFWIFSPIIIIWDISIICYILIATIIIWLKEDKTQPFEIFPLHEINKLLIPCNWGIFK